MSIVYIHGEDNCVADALLHIPEGAFPDEQPTKATPPTPYLVWKLHIGVVLSISMDQSVLKTIKNGYETDKFCLCLAQNATPGACLINGLWYIRDHLVIPRTGDICKNLFCLTHDTPAILVLINVMQTCMMLTIGQTCEWIWRSHMYLHVLTANGINLRPPKPPALYTHYQSLMNMAIVWHLTLLDCYLRMKATTAYLP